MLSKLKTKKYYILAIALVLIIVFIILISERDEHSNIAIISITGEIISSTRYNSDGSIDKNNTVSLDVINKIQKANEDKRIKAIVFLIDSPGGSVQSGEEIVKAIKEIKKPTVSLIRSQGESAAYWIASATGYIFSSEASNIGSIGVTMSYVDYNDRNNTDGLTFNQLSYGKYKDIGNPNKPLTIEEKELLMEQLQEFADIFIKGVAENRHLPVENIRVLADGSIITASNALKNGLIDEIGSFADIDRYLSSVLKIKVKIKILNDKTKEEEQF